MTESQHCLNISVRTMLSGHRVGVIQFVPYRNFVMQADKVKRTMLDKDDLAVPYEAREHALRALVEKYVKLGLKREILQDLLRNILSLELNDKKPPMDADARG